MTFVAATNEEHQARIKKRLNPKWKGGQIFDLLLEHGSLTRGELCKIIGIVSGAHSFSYGLKELKDKNFVKGKGHERLALTDEAFLPGEKPETTEPDHELIAELMKATAKTKLPKKAAGSNKKKAKTAVASSDSEDNVDDVPTTA